MPTITITVTAQQATRIADAVGAKLHLVSVDANGVTSPRPATIAEVRGLLVDYLRAVVKTSEYESQTKAIDVPDLGDVTG